MGLGFRVSSYSGFRVEGLGLKGFYVWGEEVVISGRRPADSVCLW